MTVQEIRAEIDECIRQINNTDSVYRKRDYGRRLIKLRKMLHKEMNNGKTRN